MIVVIVLCAVYELVACSHVALYSPSFTIGTTIAPSTLAMQIGAEGVANLTALNSLLSLQKVPYDFGFYKMDFEVDHPSISVSLGRSVVPTSASFPVVPSSGRRRGSAGWDADETVREVVDAGMLARVRLYIEATRRMELSLDEESSKMAEEDFVQTRQQGREVTVSPYGFFTPSAQ